MIWQEILKESMLLIHFRVEISRAQERWEVNFKFLIWAIKIMDLKNNREEKAF